MKIFKIEENDAFQRLDKFLKKLFPNATRSLIYKLNRKEKIKVKTSPQPSPSKEEREIANKFKKRDNEYKLQIGDEVKIFLSDEEFGILNTPILTQSFPCQGEENTTPFSPQGGETVRNEQGGVVTKENIVYEDSDLLILNKNAGINVHAGDYKTKESNIISQVHDYLGNKFDSLTFRPSLVHRIDRDTSGILLIAKKKNILTQLVNDFKNHKRVKKIYYAIVVGELPEKEGIITKKLERIENAQNENKVRVSKNGQKAVTNYKVLNKFNLKTKEGDLVFSELEVEIKTGRMHQIRVHLADLGNPILGDKIYGDKKLNAFLEKNYGLKRQALHAWKIEFFHYGRGKEMKLEAKIKEDIKEFLEKIKK